ncbi:hypothetical protein FRC02_005968 [Tulasnella sp. 418]|nr:hypothetical protein FRC02_005968 [Tulasnella sp. 418]
MAPPSAKRPAQLHFRDIVERVMAKTEEDSKAHQVFRSYPGHNRAQRGSRHPNADEDTLPGIVSPGSTGVIYCTDRAMANGFTYTDPEWANLGQGAPETGPLPDAPPRPQSVSFTIDSLEYGPTTGVKELREAVANLYNVLHRKDKESKYTADNVCIVPGGRAGLTRVAAVIGDVYTAYQIPDYTAYSEMLSVFKRLVPIPTALEADKMYNLDIEQVKKDIHGQGLQVILASNPRNPTGQVIEGEELASLVALSRKKTTVILDEFYSWQVEQLQKCTID